MEKMVNLKRADNLTTAELAKVMSENYEIYSAVLDEIVDSRVQHAIEYLENLKGVEFHSYTFGSVYNNDYEAQIKNIDEFLNNDFNSDNGTFYELLNELKKDKGNVELQKSLLNMLFDGLDSDVILENYGLEEITCYESDAFDNWLNQHDMAVDMNTYKLYSSYELERIGVDYLELD